MTISPVDICNMAINRLSGESILAIGENTKEGRASNIHYPLARDFTLAGFDWSFARSTEKLNRLDAEHPFGYVYQLPNGCLRPLRLYPRIRGKRNWRIEGNTLIDMDRMNGDQYLEFTKRVEDSALFTMPFIDLLVLDLALRMCPVIAVDLELCSGVRRELFAARELDLQIDANIGESEPARTRSTNPFNDSYVDPSNALYEED